MWSGDGFWSENRDIVAGGAGAAFAPVSAFLFGIPVWAAIPGAILVYYGVRTLLAPRSLFESIDARSIEAGRLEFARALLTDALKELRTLKEHANGIRRVSVRKAFEHLLVLARRVIADVEKDPTRATSVQRLLTYYLPSAVRLAEGYRVLERKMNPNPERVRQVEQTIVKLDEIFRTYADKLVTRDMDDLDLEMKLLEDEIRDEKRS